jgi:hypothetical protein
VHCYGDEVLNLEILEKCMGFSSFTTGSIYPIQVSFEVLTDLSKIDDQEEMIKTDRKKLIGLNILIIAYTGESRVTD